ncbi:Glutathione-regulated potassium-efflux system protein KefB [uncultured archaeon]|nr:Glutathione-regulated potassium-efflux system protein KefB [uncultured archaeon]
MALLDQFFLSFGLLSVVALFGAFLATRWRQPTVVGLIIAGVLLGPYGLGLIKDTAFIQMFAQFGAAMLLFSIGVEFSLSKILGSGVKALVVASAIMLGLFITGYEIGVLLNLDYLQTLAIGACLSFSSTAIFVRILSQYQLMEQPQIPLLISVLVIEDLVAVAALAFFGAMGSETAQAGNTPALDILLSLLFSMVLMGTVYLGIRATLKRTRRFTESLRTRENLVLLALGMCVLLAFLSTLIGLSPAIGAFMAGSILAGTPMREEVERVISPFSLAFSSFFFISIGLLVNPAAALSSWPLILLASGGFMLASLAVVTSVVFFAGYRFEQALVSGLAMGCLGEFSLFLAQQSAPLLGSLDLVTVMSSSVVLTTIAVSLMLSRYPSLVLRLQDRCGRASRSWLCRVRGYTSSVLAEFEGQGVFLQRAHSVFALMRRHLTLFALVGMALFLTRRLFSSSTVSLLGYSIHLPTLALAASLLLLLPALGDILAELGLLGDALTMVLTRGHPGDERAGRRMARDFMLLLALLALLLLQTLAIDVMGLPDFLHFAIFVPMLAMGLVVWDMLSILHQEFARKAENGRGF